MKNLTLESLITLIGLVITLAAALVMILITDPAHAKTWADLITGTIGPLLITAAGIFWVVWKSKDNVAQANLRAARANAEAAKASADASYFQALRAGKIPGKLPEKKPYGSAPVPQLTYTVADIEPMLQGVINGLQADNMLNEVIKAERFYDAVAAYDLRMVPREARVTMATALMKKVFELDTEAWRVKVGIPDLPTPEQCAQKTRYMYQFKKEYEKANNMACGCGDIDYTMISSLLGYFSNAYEALFGLEKLMGVTVDWSTFGNSQYSAQMVGWYYAKLII